eukprot:403340772
MSVRNSKALIGGLFIQYCAYSVFYLLDEFKEIAPQMYKEVPQNNADGDQNNQEFQEEAKANGRRGNSGPQNRKQVGKIGKILKNDRELSKEEEEDFKKFEENRMQSITNEIVEYFPRMMFFHSLVVTFCAIRSPTDTAVVLTFFCIILRILMVFGWYCKRKFVYVSSGAAEALINVILFLITLSYNPY